MADFEISSLNISGYKGKPVPNRFFRSTAPTAERAATRPLAVLLPGLRYTCDMPLLYYPTQLLLQRGVDVLQLHTDYTRPEYQGSSGQEQAHWLAADAQAAVQAGLAQGNPAPLILAGKSIGTLALAHLVASGAAPGAITLWFTPLLGQPQLVEAAMRIQGPALFFGGTGDPTYQPETMARIQKAVGAEIWTFEGANHSLEIPGDLFASLHIIEQVLHGIDGFLERHDVKPT